MNIRKFHIYLANLDPPYGTEPGKTRPVIVVQTNFLNNGHLSTIVCPTTTKMIPDSTVLRIHLDKIESGLRHDSQILVDQICAIDNRRFIKEIGRLDDHHQKQLMENLKVLIFE